jgi:hypothetical protein
MQHVAGCPRCSNRIALLISAIPLAESRFPPANNGEVLSYGQAEAKSPSPPVQSTARSADVKNSNWAGSCLPAIVSASRMSAPSAAPPNRRIRATSLRRRASGNGKGPATAVHCQEDSNPNRTNTNHFTAVTIILLRIGVSRNARTSSGLTIRRKNRERMKSLV